MPDYWRHNLVDEAGNAIDDTNPLPASLIEKSADSFLVDDTLALNNGATTNGGWFPASQYSELRACLAIGGTGDITVTAEWSPDMAVNYTVYAAGAQLVLANAVGIVAGVPRLAFEGIPPNSYIRLVYLASAAGMTATLTVEGKA